MGKNERVETDHAEWQTKDALALAYSDKPATSGAFLPRLFSALVADLLLISQALTCAFILSALRRSS